MEPPPSLPPAGTSPEPVEADPRLRTSRGVLNELARGFLLGVRSQNAESAARFASQFLRDQMGAETDRPPPRPRTIRGPLPRAAADGRSLEPPPHA